MKISLESLGKRDFKPWELLKKKIEYDIIIFA